MHHSNDRISASPADELRRAISGGVALPGDKLYDAANRIWNGAVRHRPALIAFCDRPQDVQAAVHAARRYGLSVSIRGGRHEYRC
jgi:FAD/FMN-containing dehydrogenase